MPGAVGINEEAATSLSAESGKRKGHERWRRRKRRRGAELDHGDRGDSEEGKVEAEEVLFDNGASKAAERCCVADGTVNDEGDLREVNGCGMDANAREEGTSGELEVSNATRVKKEEVESDEDRYCIEPSSSSNFPDACEDKMSKLDHGGSSETSREIKVDNGAELKAQTNVESDPGIDTPPCAPKKRKRVSQKDIITPDVPLRRSARRAATAALLSPPRPHVAAKDEAVEKPVLKKETCVDCTKEPLIFPPSSKDLELNDLPVLDVFSVYTCLRSFSTLLFLSPFSLKEFTAALKCNSPNSLIDSVHYSILQALKGHLECLSEEGSELASDCLRSINWELLDIVNWPLYLAEYLLVHHSATSSCLNLLSGEHYDQPASVKLQILRHLCDDVIEVEAIRSELNRRMSESDANMDISLNEGKGKDINMNDLRCPFSTKEDFEETSDGNSDECCLCKMDGSLICCDGCPAAFHSRCVGMARDLLPEGEWFCPECLVESVDKNTKPSRPFQGAEILGIDPDGRIYFGSCDYLLVSEPSDTGTSYHYYNRDDLNNVIELLKRFNDSYGSIISSITSYWQIPVQYPGSGSCTDWSGHGQHLNVAHQFVSEIADGEKIVEKVVRINSNSFCDNPQNSTGGSVESRKFEFESAATSQLTGLIRFDSSSEGPVAVEQAHCSTRVPMLPRTEATCISASPRNEDVDLSSKYSEIVLGKQIEPPTSNKIPLSSEKINDAAQVHSNNGGYVNCYSFGHIASLIAIELSKSSNDVTKDSSISAEDIISGQLRAIYKKIINGYWSAIQRLPVNAQKESCGWCFVCKNAGEQECLLRIIETKVLVGPRNRMVGLHSKDNKRNHILSVIHHILQIEDGSHGLLSGPWENPHHKKQWRKQVLKSVDVASLKYLLLTLEDHLRRISLSSEWFKPVDADLVVGSASYVMTCERGITTRKHTRKNASEIKRMSDTGASFLSNCASSTTIYWWRGGKLSRQVFQWKVLPQSLASKGGRQAGCKKIPGIFYLDGSDFAKRSKNLAWRAAVENSQNLAQLAYQVKDLDSHIRWNEIGPPLSQLVKDPRKPPKPSWKAIICEKSVEGAHVNYLIDFGKRRIIPDVVTKYGVLHEESIESKKYWLEESHVPVNLLKSFEVRNLEQILKKSSSEVCTSEWNRHKRAHLRRQRGLTLLLSRGEKSDQNICSYCNEVILEREEAVSCQFCEGFIHKNHFRVPKGAISTSYRCYVCKDKKYMNERKETKIPGDCMKKGVASESSDKKHDGSRGKKFINGNENWRIMDQCMGKKSENRRKNRKCTKQDAQLLYDVKNEGLMDECDERKPPSRRKGKESVRWYLKKKSEEGFKNMILNAVKSKQLSRSRKRKTKVGMSKVLVLRKSERLAKKKQQKPKSKKKNVGRKKAKQSLKRKEKPMTPEKKKGGISCRGQRTGICPPYWLNGLLWTRKAYDERAVHFRETRILLPFPNSKDNVQAVCSLCLKEYDSQMIYVGCESCGDWFHGDAFSLTLVNINNVRGFKCHRCRTQSTPVCPHLVDNEKVEFPEVNKMAIDHPDDSIGQQCLAHDIKQDFSDLEHGHNLNKGQQAVSMPDSGQILKQSAETTGETIFTDTDTHLQTEAEDALHSSVKCDADVVDEEYPS